MKNIHLFLLLGLLLVACDKDDKKEQPIFVTNIVMPAEGTVFNAGDKITIKAQGFQENDRIMLHGRWPMAEAPGGEGYYISPAKVTEMTATSLTFLAPGYNPPATVEVKLLRSGDREMTLGMISVADGRAPEEPQLYGVINNRGGVMGVRYAVEHIDIETGMTTDVASLGGKNTDFSRVVGTKGHWNWGLFGIHTADGNSSISRLDLSMRYWEGMGSGSVITLGTLNTGSIVTIYKQDENKVCVVSMSATAYTRDQNYTPSNRLVFSLPEGMKPEAMSNYPCALGQGTLLLSADNGDGSFAPVALDLTKVSGGSANVGSSIKAERLIPFWTMMPVEGEEAATYARVTGYAVVLPDNGGTELRLLDLSTMTLQEPFATFPNSARSIAPLGKDADTLKLYVLFDTQRGRIIEEYDMATGQWNRISDMEYAFEELAVTW